MSNLAGPWTTRSPPSRRASPGSRIPACHSFQEPVRRGRGGPAPRTGLDGRIVPGRGSPMRAEACLRRLPVTRALAAAGDPGQHPDRSVALGVAVCGPDDAVAARLEQAAERAHASAAGTRPRRRSCPGRLSCQWTSACAPRGCSQQPMRSSPSPDSIGPVRCWTGSGRVQRPWPRDGCTTPPINQLTS
jgi:hypothetical protein